MGAFYNRLRGRRSAAEYTPGIPGMVRTAAGHTRPRIPADGPASTFEEKALFGEVGYQFTERWQVTVGARWFDYDDDLAARESFPFFATRRARALRHHNQTGDNDAIFKFNTSYRVHAGRDGLPDDQRGLSPGRRQLGPAVPGPVPDEQSFCLKEDEVLIKPDTTTNYEVGLRSLWLDGRLIVNAAVY